MATKKTKDIIFYATGLVVTAASSFVGVSVNHYWHRSTLLVAPLVLVLIAFWELRRRVSFDKSWILKTVTAVLSLGLVAFYAWAVGQKTSDADFSGNLVSFSSNTVHMVSSDKAEANDSAKVTVFLNPNCQACQYGVPKLYRDLQESGKVSQVDFVDVTVESKYADSVGVEKTPTAYVKSGKYKGLQRFAYHTESGENRLYQEQYDNVLNSLG